jgi:exonuclease SbcC
MKEIKSIRIANFQSHEQTYIELCGGLNVFVGESRNGKTSILRALRWLYFNEPRGDRFIRAGKKCCEVEVTLVDGTRVLRIRDDSRKVNGYILYEPGKDEQPFSKFNKEVPLEIQRALGVSKLWLDKDTAIELNFSRQMDAAFMVSDSPPKRAKIIGRVVNLHIIDSANRTACNDLNNAKRRKDELDADLKSLEKKMVAFDDLPEQEIVLSKAQELVSQANALKTKADKLQEILDNIIRVQSAIEDNNQCLLILSKIEDAETILQKLRFEQNRVTALDEVLSKINASKQELESKNQLLDKLSKLETVFTLVETMKMESSRLSNLEAVEQQINTTQLNLGKHRETLSRLQSLDTVETYCTEISEKINLIKQLTDLNNQITANRKSLDTVEDLLSRTANIEQSQEIIGMLYKLRDKGYNLNEVNVRIKNTQRQLKDCLLTIEKLKRVDDIPDLLSKVQDNISRLKNLLTLNQNIQSFKEKYEDCLAEIASSEMKYSKLQKQYSEALQERGECPVCHTIMTPEVIERLVSGF